MNRFKLKIVTPKEIILEREAQSITVPGAGGELTILYNHTPFFSLLTDGVVTIRNDKDESLYSIGGGYVETTGKLVTLLVSRALGQDELDEKEIEHARAQAEKMLKEAPEKADREEALRTLKRSIVDMKVLSKARIRKRHTSVTQSI